LSDAEWELLAPLIPVPKPGGRPAIHERREIVNALAYWVRAGCAWRLLPHNLPRRWVVERTFAWLGKYRRLTTDYEYLTATSENVIYLAMSMILPHRHSGRSP
jgi:transposase